MYLPSSKLKFIKPVNIHKIDQEIIINVKKIVNVYKLQYKNCNAIYGFGDFLRGCFCLIQICGINGLDFDIDVSNHPISKYMNNQQLNPTINYNEIEMYMPPDNPINCYNTFINLLKNETSEVYYTCLNSFPILKIKQSEIDFIKSRIEPNLTIKTDVDLVIKNLNLISNEFTVIHIRFGDMFLLHNSEYINEEFVNEIFKYLKPLLDNVNSKYLILSDNYKLKILFSKFKNCVFNINPITHLGVHSTLKDENIKNTLIDFYLMCHSNKIYSISSYGHGSGFSKWCSVIYNIPYTSKIILNT
jgi:hypothetical protein